MLASLKETFPGIDWEKQGAYFFQRVIEHGRRRSEEVRGGHAGALPALRGYNPLISPALIKSRLKRLASAPCLQS